MVRIVHHWQKVTSDTATMRVPGGWLYRCIHIPYMENEPATISMVFVPRPRGYMFDLPRRGRPPKKRGRGRPKKTA